MLKKLTLLFGLATSISTFSQINSGDPNIPFGSNTSYEFGISPSNLPTSGTYGASTEAASAWETFKSGYVEDCGSGTTRVKFDNQSETVSEGIAYTMLLAAYAADQDVFDGLWAYYKINRNDNGVMNWKINGCSNSTLGQNGATDAELDAAMALIVADKQWGSTGQTHSYDTDAIELIEAIGRHEVSNSTFNNGDGWGDADGCRNPSYQSPAYARVFSLFLVEKGELDRGWTSVATATATLLKDNSGQTSSGLPSNWSLESGTPDNSCSASGTTPSSFGYDATRAPWRQGTDYLWFGTESSGMQTIVNTQTDFWINRGGSSQVIGGNNFSQSGSGSGDHNGAFIGMVGAQSLAASNTTAHQSFVDDMYTENKNVDFDGYFPRVLRCLGLFVQTGNFWNPYSSALNGDKNNPTVSITAPSDNFETCLGVDYTINASASDIDGSIAKVEFYDGNTLLGSDDTAPFTYDVTDNTAGVKTYRAQAYDNDDLTSFSSSITVTVTSIQSTDGVTCAGSSSSDEFNAAIDDFDSEDQVSLGASGDYGIYWWTPVGSSIYEINRTETNMVLTLNGADPEYEVFGVGFGEGKSINLQSFSNADIRLNLTNNSNTDITLSVQLKDVNGNAAEIVIEDEMDITWNNQWKKLGLEIGQGQTIDQVIDLSSTPDQLGGFSALSYGCATAVECPTVSYDLDPTQISEIVFIVNGGAGEDNTLTPATGELIFNYFSIGETDNENSNIIETGATPPLVDSDGDLVDDALDLCDDTPVGQSVDADGCSTSQLDTDDDGVTDDTDLCSNTPEGTTVDETGCAIIIAPDDADGDGIEDTDDLCANTPLDETANADGCSTSQLDSDGDNVMDDVDLCPNTPSGTTVDATGCETTSNDLYTPIVSTLTDATDFDFAGIDYAYDDFNSLDEKFDETTEAGIFWWDGEKEEDGEVFFSSVKERRACDGTPGGVAYTVTQNANKYEPFGVAFGEATNMTPFTIDLTNNSNLELVITNESNRELTIRAAIQDYEGNILDFDIDETQVQVAIAAGGTETLSANYQNGYWYDYNSTGCSPCINEAADFFDYAHVRGVNITVISGDDHWMDDAENNIVDAVVTITSFKVGNTDGVVSQGCATEVADADGDGIEDANDLCANTPSGEDADTDGCSTSQLDTDNDGVNDNVDQCPSTALGANVDETGCLIDGLEDASSLGIEIFPIPASETLNIVQSTSNMTKATLLNVSGRIVLETTLDSNSETISVQGIESGMYILQLDGDEGSTQRQLIIE